MIQTDRLTLRPYSLADYAPHLAMCSEMEVVRFLDGQPSTPEDAWHRVLRYAGHWALLGYGIFAVIETATGQYIGETGIADFHRGLGDAFDQAAEASWVFSAKTHGRGYALEAAAAAHQWYNSTTGGQRTVCIIHPENRPSLKLAARLGYAAFGEQKMYKGQPVIMLERHRTAG